MFRSPQRSKNQFAPRINTPRPETKPRNKWLYIIPAIIALVAIAIGGWQYVNSQVLVIGQVNIEQLMQAHPDVAPHEQMRNLTQELLGDSLLMHNDQALIEDWLKRMPAVDKISTHKEYPSTLVIKFIPRVALSQLDTKQGNFLVDRRGNIFAKTAESVEKLPTLTVSDDTLQVGQTISAEGIKLGLMLVEGLRTTEPRLESIVLQKGQLDVTLASNPKILINESRPANTTLLEIETLLNKFKEDKKYPKELDMRYSRPILRY